MINKNQIKIAQTLISKCKLRAQKANIVIGFSGGRTEHVSELSYGEAAELIKYLRAVDSGQTVGNRQTAEKMRRKIISMAHEMNWKVPLNPPEGERARTGKIDMKRVDGWCKKYGYLHKPLDDYSYKELPRLLTQFENGPYKHYISNL